MSEQREVQIYFGKDHKLQLVTEDAEGLIDQITSEESGWFRYKDIVIKRSEIKYAGIVTPKAPAKAKAVRSI